MLVLDLQKNLARSSRRCNVSGTTSSNLRKRRWIVLGGALGALAVFLLLVIAVSTESDPASAASSGPEMVLNVTDGGTCDDPVRPTTCDIPSSGTFTVHIDAVVVPAAGYVSFQSYLDFGTRDLTGSEDGGGLAAATTASTTAAVTALTDSTRNAQTCPSSTSSKAIWSWS